jgi:hypothetical protein
MQGFSLRRSALERRTRWARFSLRALVVAFTLLAVGLAVLGSCVREGERQAAVLRKIEELGGYPYRLHSYGEYLFNADKTTRRQLRPLIYDYLLGKDFFTYAPIIVLDGPSVTAADIRAMIPYIEQVRIKEGCNNGETYLALCVRKNPNVDGKFVEYLERRLPRCRVVPEAGD